MVATWEERGWSSFPFFWPEKLLFKVPSPSICLPTHWKGIHSQLEMMTPSTLRPPAIPSWNSMLGNGVEEEEIGK